MTVAEDVLAGSVDEYCSADVDPRAVGRRGAEGRSRASVFGIDADRARRARRHAASQRGVPGRRSGTSSREATPRRKTIVGTRAVPPARRHPAAARRRRAARARSTRRPPTSRRAIAGRAVLEPISRSIMLQIVDAQWKDHLYSLDHLKEGIGLRGYGQRDPLVEYKKESFALFQGMKERIDEEMVRYLWRLRPVISTEPADQGSRRSPCAAGRARRRRRARRSSPSATPSSRRRRRRSRAVGRRGRAGAPRPARVGGDDAPVKTGAARRAEGRPQRSVPVRQRQEVQEVPRREPVTMHADASSPFARRPTSASAFCVLHRPPCPHALTT